MKSCVGWLLLALLVVGCGGSGDGGPNGGGPASGEWQWPDTVTPSLTFAAPQTVSYPTPDGDIVEGPAVPGQVIAEFAAAVTQEAAAATIASAGGQALDYIVQRHLVLVAVAPGNEGSAIAALLSMPDVVYAGPNEVEATAAELMAIDSCVGPESAHGAEVIGILERCTGPSHASALCVDKMGDRAPNRWLTHDAMRSLLSVNAFEVVLNISLQPGFPHEWQSSWLNLTPVEQQGYLDRYAARVERILADARALLAYGRYVVITLAAGNYGVPLEAVMAALEAKPTTEAGLRDHMVIVGVPTTIQVSSNSDLSDSPHFVLVEQNRSRNGLGFGTSFAAPRVAALIWRTIEEQGLTAAGALALIKQQAAASGGVLRGTCDCTPPMRILADTVSDDLSLIDPTVALNDAGEIGFTGLNDAGLSRPYVARADGTLSTLGFAPDANRNYGGAALSAASGTAPSLLVRERVSGSPLGFVLRKWPTDGVSPDVIVGSNTTLGGGPAFDSVSLHVDVNDFGLAAASGLVDGSTNTALIAGYQRSAGPPVQPEALFKFTGVHSLRPAVSNGAQVVIQTPLGSIVRYDYPGGAATVIASTSDFAATGLSPGISGPGDLVAFYGNLTSSGASALTATNAADVPPLTAGAGIFVAVERAGGRDVIRVAALDAEFTAFVPNLRVAVGRLHSRAVAVCYEAVRNGSLGLYLRVLDFGDVVPGIGVSSATRVLQVGDSVYDDVNADGDHDAGEMLLAGTLADVSFQHPFSKSGTRDLGLWVRMTTGEQAVVRVAPCH